MLHLHLPPDAPVALVASLSALGAIVSNLWREGRRAYLKADAADGPLFARYSTDRIDLPVIAHEVEVRRIVGEDGALRTPPVIDAGEDWLIEARKDADLVGGPEAVDSVLAAAADLAERELPAVERNGARRTSALLTVRRRVNMALSDLPLRDVARARAIVANSPLPMVTSHGDLHAGNVLMAGGKAWVVDWELSGMRPVGYDLMQFWATLAEERDRSRLWDGAVELVGQEHERELADLRYALAVRTLVNKLCSPDRLLRDFEGARRILALLPAIRT